MKFSKKKFMTLSKEHRATKILKALQEIKQTQCPETRNEEISNLQAMYSYIEASEQNIMPDLRNLCPDITPHNLHAIIAACEQSQDIHVRDHDFIIQKADGECWSEDSIPLVVVCDNLRSAFNIGSIIRTSECLQVKEIILCGYTPTPTHKQVQKTSMGTYKHIKWQHYDETINCLKNYKNAGYRIYALETTTNAQDIYAVSIPSPLVLVLGNEALGISKEVLAHCDEVIQIPLHGWKNSLNVGVAFAVSAFEIARKWRNNDR